MHRGVANIALSLGLTAAQVGAQFAPVPYLGPAVNVLCGIIQVCAQVTSNKFAACQLRDRCHMLLLAFKDDKGADSPDIQKALDEIMKTLFDVKNVLDGWVNANRLLAFARQGEITLDIQRCNAAISDCITKFQITSHLEILDWQAEFEANHTRDHQEVIKFLSEIQNSQTITNDVLNQQSGLLYSIMSMMQNALGDSPGDVANNGLQSNLYQLQLNSRMLLPDFNLNRGEVRRLGDFPVGSSSTGLDIWEGIYLNREKVAIKVVRSVNANPRSLKRFMREVQIWGRIWEIDQGKHVVPFYGFCQNDGPYPYMISPWQNNGNAYNYVKQNPFVDHREMIRAIGQGILLLHTLEPPVIHGDIRGANIMIDTWGNPLLADFSISRIVEDITGVPFTRSHGVNESYRWFAPELCIGEGTFSTASDMYAFSMTILELMTHECPFERIKHTTEVVIKAARGERPRYPTDTDIIGRGLDDLLWRLMARCWRHEAAERPSIQDVLAEL